MMQIRPIKTIILILIMVALTCSCGAKKIEWYTNLKKGMAEAKNNKKPALILFSDPEDCYACSILDKEVFGSKEWPKLAGENFVHIRFVTSKSKKISAAKRAYIKKMQDLFQVDYIPHVILIDASGKTYGIAGFKRYKPKKYFAHLKSFENQLIVINKTLKALQTTNLDKKRQLLASFLQQLRTWQIDYAYNDLKKTMIKIDKDNKLGENARCSAELYKYLMRQNKEKEASQFLKILRSVQPIKADTLEARTLTLIIERTYFELFQWKIALGLLKKYAVRFRQGEAAQLVHYYMGRTQYQLQDKTGALRSIQKALQFAPKSKLSKKIKRWLKILR